MTRQLKLGIPKGSLEKSTMELFLQAGWKIDTHSRNYFPSVNDPDLYCALVRPQEMARYVTDGTLDLGLTGQDWIIERDCQDEVANICELEYSKSTNKPCRWVLVVPKDSPIQSVADLQGKKIATELVNFTQKYLQQRQIQADVQFSWGATEAKVVEGLVDAVVEITETGSTIRAHGLRIVADLLETRTQLIANKDALRDPWKKTKIDQVALLLQAALAARHHVVLKMNVAENLAEEVVKMLPCLRAPTVSHLYRTNWVAVETVVNRNLVRDLIPRLKEMGAEGILEYDLQKVV
ncbi:MAG: ATP phosphoribosyltransferase [Magnetococcales bacterium]|nr:ATP phosphoribosyltransferase [Magnetococcales bacterium]MBF0322878.1 ATP phosphoribosyltransferase [Magnetococcales bacterium]